MVIGCGLWVIGYWLLVVGYWLLVRMQIDRTVYLTIIPTAQNKKTKNQQAPVSGALPPDFPQPKTNNQKPTTKNQQPKTNNPNNKSNGLLLQLSIHRMHTPP